MPEFVCPECDESLTSDGEQDLVESAINHMMEEHGKKNVSSDYVEGNIRAHA